MLLLLLFMLPVLTSLLSAEADLISQSFYDAIDQQLTWKHAISCNWTVGMKIPVVAGTDAEVFLACCRTAGVRDVSSVRACRVVNTLKVGAEKLLPLSCKPSGASCY